MRQSRRSPCPSPCSALSWPAWCAVWQFFFFVGVYSSADAWNALCVDIKAASHRPHSCPLPCSALSLVYYQCTFQSALDAACLARSGRTTWSTSTAPRTRPRARCGRWCTTASSPASSSARHVDFRRVLDISFTRMVPSQVSEASGALLLMVYNRIVARLISFVQANLSCEYGEYG